jgi:predicted ATPase/DNA-binding CsgD family transcriptional regulator
VSDARLNHAGEVPAELSTFVGRDTELATLLELMRTARLVTVLGGGGVGKTALTRRAAVQLQQDNMLVRWAALNEVPRSADPADVEHAIATAFSTADFSSESVSPLRRLLEQFNDRPGVLVLDTCEHLVRHVARLVPDLLTAAPGLRIVVTSQIALDVEGEKVVRIEPLGYPAPGDPPATRYASVDLLVSRAGDLGVTLGASHMPAARDLCERLQGVPLAIVLAAGRLRRLSLQQILQGLEDRQALEILTGGPRYGAPDTHQSVSDALNWSVSLCSEAERTLLSRCAVFLADWDMQALLEVCVGDNLNPDQVPDLLDQLIAIQLVKADTLVHPPRYGMLDTVRLFAQQIGQSGDDWEALRRRHRDHHQRRARQAATEWAGPAEVGWLNWAVRSMPDLLAAHEWSLEQPGEAPAALNISLSLVQLREPYFQGRLSQGRARIERALAVIVDSGDYDLTTPTIAVMVRAGQAMCCWIANCQGDRTTSQHYFDLIGQPITGLPHGTPPLPPVHFATGGFQLLVQHNRAAIRSLGQARAAFASNPATQGDWLMARLIEAMAASFLGDRDEAMRITQLCLDEAQRTSAPWHWEWARLVRGIALLRFGDPAVAVELLRDTLGEQRKIGDRWGVVWAVLAVAWALAAQLAAGKQQGSAEDAATIVAMLLGGSQKLCHDTGVDLAGLVPFAKLTAQAQDQALAVLRGTTYDRNYAQGLGMTRGQILDLAQGSPLPWRQLSLAEREIALWIAADVTVTNRTIAEARGTKPRTVESQVSGILNKLNLQSRHEIRVWLSAANLDHLVTKPTP